jgi:pimeloyl-ACP methyl ester carboxylesterase
VEGDRVTTVEVAGVELRCRDRGAGPAVLMVHETAAGAEVWRGLADALGREARVVAFDRRGWGGSAAPEVYARTTIEEQAGDAAGVLDGLGISEALVCGAGIGAVVALELLLRQPALVTAAALIEPPLLAFLPEATEGLSADRLAIEEAFRDGGPRAALDLYLDGGLPFLGPGADRIPEPLAAAARRRPLSLFAELAAVPAWPIRPPALAAVSAPSRIVVGASTPPHLLAAAGELAARLGGSERVRLDGGGLPHLDSAAELAAQLRPLL